MTPVQVKNGAVSSPISSQRRTALWEAMLDAEMNVSFWTLMSQRYTRIDRAGKIVIALTSSGTVAAWSLWEQYPAIWKILSALACITSILYPILWPAEQQKKISRLVGNWKQIGLKYQLLWEQDSELSTPEAWKQFEKARLSEGKIDETRAPVSKRLIRAAYSQVLRRRGLQTKRLLH